MRRYKKVKKAASSGGSNRMMKQRDEGSAAAAAALAPGTADFAALTEADVDPSEVRRCRLPLSNPR